MDSLVDLSPTVQLLAIGAALAGGPLVWWLWSQARLARLGGHAPTASSKLRALVVITLFLTFDLVLFGAFTRLTDSGLGCPDWPGCYGSASPIGAARDIAAAESAMPTGPVTLQKAWIEMIHRKAATGIGALITLIMVLGWAWRAKLLRERQVSDPAAQYSPWLGVLVFIWVCAQGAFGALTVTLKLKPIIVTLHLMGGIGLLMVLAALAEYLKIDSNKPNESGDQGPISHQKGVIGAAAGAFARPRWLLVSFAAVWVQVALGGWVSTNYAVLACTDFPACQGGLWPAMNFSQAFALWRDLGLNADGSNLSFQALTAIHYVHRLSAYVVFAVVGWSAWRLWQGSDPADRVTAKWLAFLLAWQLATGLGNVLLGWPLVAAVSHTGGAAGLVLVLTQALGRHRIFATIKP